MGRVMSDLDRRDEAGLQGPGNRKEQDKGEWYKVQLVLQAPTFWDYVTYVI